MANKGRREECVAEITRIVETNIRRHSREWQYFI